MLILGWTIVVVMIIESLIISGLFGWLFVEPLLSPKWPLLKLLPKWLWFSK